MRKLTISFLSIIFFLSTPLFSQEVNVFSKKKISMGEIPHRDTMRVNFTYTNKSDKVKIILDAKTNCECTWLEYPKSPVSPNKTIELTLVYHAKDKGVFAKNIDILISDNKRYRVTAIGQVVDKRQKE